MALRATLTGVPVILRFISLRINQLVQRNETQPDSACTCSNHTSSPTNRVQHICMTDLLFSSV